MKHGMIGLALSTASVAALAANHSEPNNSTNELQTLANTGCLNIDPQDFMGGSKLKDRMIEWSGKTVEFTVIQELNA